jgi:hypothetical protein
MTSNSLSDIFYPSDSVTFKKFYIICSAFAG